MIIQDPYDWTADQVILSLSVHGRLLLKLNAPLSLPDADTFAEGLRERRVTDFALLKVVDSKCLGDDSGLKLLIWRAIIVDLIQQLQTMSSKF